MEEQRKMKKQEKKQRKKLSKRKHEESSLTTDVESSGKKGKVVNYMIDELDGDSPFQEKQLKVLISLPPSALSNIPSALNSSMQGLLLKYSDSLGGVLISYQDIQLDESSSDAGHGRIINEMPHIHYHVKCNVLVFNPSVGTVLRGKVNESFPSHVGLLVHELFNAMISSELLRQNGFQFDDEAHEWRKSEGSVDRVIKINDGMEFTVHKLHECNGMISLDCKNPVFLDESS